MIFSLRKIEKIQLKKSLAKVILKVDFRNDTIGIIDNLERF